MRGYLKLICFLVAASAANGEVCDSGAFETRLGFSSWPTDMSVDGVDRAYDFIAHNGDIILQHLDNGVPWDEALADDPFPANLRQDWQTRRDKSPEGMPVFLALNPLNFERDGLAAAWTDAGEGQALSAFWQDKPLNDPDVIDAFVTYALEGIAYFEPDYLAIGIESNILISKVPQKWVAYLELNASVYTAIKAVHPDLPVFSTVQYEHLRGIETVSHHYAFLQQSGVAALMQYSDILALSTYRYGSAHPNPPSPEYFQMALSYGKPVAISESGASSKSVIASMVPLPSSEQVQTEFVRMLLQAAQDHEFEFLINWVNVDFDGLLAELPEPVRDIASAWVFTGLENYDGSAKPALAVWRNCLGR